MLVAMALLAAMLAAMLIILSATAAHVLHYARFYTVVWLRLDLYQRSLADLRVQAAVLRRGLEDIPRCEHLEKICVWAHLPENPPVDSA